MAEKSLSAISNKGQTLYIIDEKKSDRDKFGDEGVCVALIIRSLP
jgi:hypothetical protein